MSEQSFDELIERQRNLDAEYFAAKRELLRAELLKKSVEANEKWITTPQLNPERQKAVRAAYAEGANRTESALDVPLMQYAVGLTAKGDVNLGFWDSASGIYRYASFFVQPRPPYHEITWWPV